jgi:hypothetical protein
MGLRRSYDIARTSEVSDARVVEAVSGVLRDYGVEVTPAGRFLYLLTRKSKRVGTLNRNPSCRLSAELHSGNEDLSPVLDDMDRALAQAEIKREYKPIPPKPKDVSIQVFSGGRDMGSLDDLGLSVPEIVRLTWAKRKKD